MDHGHAQATGTGTGSGNGSGSRNGFHNLGVIVLAGGRGSRMGGVDKAQVEVGGRRLIDYFELHLHRAVPGCAAVAVSPHGVKWSHPVTCENPAFGGPVAGIAAGYQLLAKNPVLDTVAVLAVDAPHSPLLLPALAQRLHASPQASVSVIRDDTGRLQPLCALWRRQSLSHALRALGEPRNKPVKALFDHATAVAEVHSPGTGWLRDYDTREDLEDFKPGV
ncbi:molybdenum cofactor guanylyltransferase [Corynebacterium phocae]|nr:molybdenum cofactor guanylyltransferase [Corynebacterium phocae]KAA8723351.1 molybdenum cofactor guanylyltransferase [Corynebacterium phocae]